MAWVIQVAWNEVKMAWRRQARVDVGEVPERPEGFDPETATEARLDLAATIHGLAALGHVERDAILSALGDTATRAPERASLKMRRYRARQHLLALTTNLNADRRSLLP